MIVNNHHVRHHLTCYRSQTVSPECCPCGSRTSSAAECSVRAFVLHEQRSWLKISLSSRDTCCRIREIQRRPSAMLRCSAEPTEHLCLTLAPKIPAILWSRDLPRPIAHRQMRQQKDTQSQQCMGLRVGSSDESRHLAGGLTTTMISSPWSISLHGTTAVRVALSGRSCQRYLAKAHRHLAVVHTCLVCMRNTDVKTFGLCHFASLFDFRISQIIQIGSPHVLPHCKSVRSHMPPSNKETCLDYFVVPVSVLV